MYHSRLFYLPMLGSKMMTALRRPAGERFGVDAGCPQISSKALQES